MHEPVFDDPESVQLHPPPHPSQQQQPDPRQPKSRNILKPFMLSRDGGASRSRYRELGFFTSRDEYQTWAVTCRSCLGRGIVAEVGGLAVCVYGRGCGTAPDVAL